MTSLPLPAVRDNLMWDLWMSMYHNPIIALALDFNLFEFIDEHNPSSEAIATKLNIKVRGIEVLTEPLVGLGLLLKRGNSYSLTSSAKTYLLRESPFYWGPIFKQFKDSIEYKKLLSAIASSAYQMLYDDEAYSTLWEKGTLPKGAALQLIEKTHASIFAPATSAIKSGIFKSSQRLLDVGAGSGCFTVAYLQQYPTYEATLFDLASVCDISKEYVQQFNLGNRVKIHAGNFFHKDDWPTDCDGILFSQILHSWSIDHCKTLLSYAYDRLPKEGSIYIHEMFLNEDRNSPLSTSCFDLLMFVNHQSQQFTQNEVFDLMRSVGFKYFKTKKTFGYFSVISAKK